MSHKLRGLQVGVLVTTGFEQVELSEPCRVMTAAGADVEFISPCQRYIWGWDFNEWGSPIHADVDLYNARASRYDALFLPGGVMNAVKLRIDSAAQAFVRAFFEADKPVATLGYAPWLLIDAGAAAGRTLTSRPSLQQDLTNAGARWVDKPAVEDTGLISGRGPDDLPAFMDSLLSTFAQAARGSRWHAPENSAVRSITERPVVTPILRSVR